MLVALAFCGGTTPPPGEIPPAPDAGATTAQGTQTFAIDGLLLGEYDRTTKAPSTTAWKAYGYNLDGKVTTKDSTDVCTAAVKTNQIDGNFGIDNAFGSVVLPILQTAASLQTPSDTVSAAMRSGLYTLQIQIDGLPDGASAVKGMTVRAFRSLRSGDTAPAFDDTTDWPVLASSVSGSDLTSALWQTADAYIADDGTFVATMTGDAVLFVPVFSDLVLPIHHATITFTRSVPNRLDGGTIAGVMFTADVIAAAKALAGDVSLSLCGSAFDGIAQQLTQASDILENGTNSSGGSCDAISIGIGFTAAKIANPTQVVADPIPTDPCTAPPPLGACTMTSVSGYTPTPLVTSKSIPGSCTSSDIETFWGACLGPNADAAACKAIVGANKCTSCLFSKRSDSLWGAIVTTPTTWSFDVAGCVAIATGSIDCASSIAAAEGCESTACASCGWVGGPVNQVDREQCIQTADVGDCATWVDAECDFVAAGAAACRVNPTDEASFAAFANVFCGN